MLIALLSVPCLLIIIELLLLKMSSLLHVRVSFVLKYLNSRVSRVLLRDLSNLSYTQPCIYMLIMILDSS